MLLDLRARQRGRRRHAEDLGRASTHKEPVRTGFPGPVTKSPGCKCELQTLSTFPSSLLGALAIGDVDDDTREVTGYTTRTPLHPAASRNPTNRVVGPKQSAIQLIGISVAGKDLRNFVADALPVIGMDRGQIALQHPDTNRVGLY